MANPKTLEISQHRKVVAQIARLRPDIFDAFDEVMIGELGTAFDQLVNDAVEAREAVSAFLDKRRYNRKV